MFTLSVDVSLHITSKELAFCFVVIAHIYLPVTTRQIASDANLLDDLHTFQCINYFVIGGFQHKFFYNSAVALHSPVEDTTVEAKDTKKSKAKDRLSVDRPSRGQGQKCSRQRTNDTTRKCSPKKKFFALKIANFPRNFRRRKQGYDLNTYLTNQKIELSSADDRTFSRT